MPRRPDIPCKHQGCGKLIPSGTKYCEDHQQVNHFEIRSTKEKGYNNAWRKARARFLKQHPLCVRCLEKGTHRRANVVDHITPHRGDETFFWDEKNWQALCKSCHDRKTMTEDRYQVFRY